MTSTPKSPTRADSTLTDAAAQQIFQDHLDVTSKLVIDGDLAAFADHVSFPFIYRTQRGETIMEAREDLIADIGPVHDWLKATGATDYHRIARHARVLSPDMIEGFHTTYALRNAVTMIEPYNSRQVLRRVDGAWTAALSEHELTDCLFETHLAAPKPGLFSADWNVRGTVPARDDAGALSLYQGLIDQMSDDMNKDNFKSWTTRFAYPAHMHHYDGDFTIEAPSDLLSFFERIRNKIADCQADWIERRASFAALSADDRLIGYHATVLVRSGLDCFTPVKSRQIYERHGDRWLCVSITNSMRPAFPEDRVLQPTEHLPTVREINERMRK